MRAALITKIGIPYEIDDVDIAEPIGHEVLIDVKASGLCHSDLILAQSDYGLPLPFVQGHEVAGVVTALGPDVRSLQLGDHVVAHPIDYCGHCLRCLRGDVTACQNYGSGNRAQTEPPRLSRRGSTVHQVGGTGGFAEQALIHENQLVAIDKAVPLDKAALLGCGVLTSVGAVTTSAKVRFGETVAVMGCGGVGLNVVQGAAISGASKVIAVDLQPTKLELARRFGATHTVNPADGDVVDQVRSITEGHGVDHAFEVIGLMPTLEQSTQMLDHHGTAYMIGMQKPGAKLAVDVDPVNSEGLLRKEQALRGVNMGSANPKLHIPLYAELYLQGRLNLDDLVSATISLDDINEGYALGPGEAARSVIIF
ncbi:Zn-dependent alcohol dehydrogenase [Streptomyces sp. WG-D5]